MANLYEINQAITECIDNETGEIIDVEKLEELQLEREAKIENVALWYKNLLSDAEAYKAEKNAFALDAAVLLSYVFTVKFDGYVAI